MASSPVLKNPTIRFVSHLLILIVCLVTGLSSVKAQTKSDWPIDYLAGFAFFKFAKVEPDFRTWVLKSPAYENGSPRERANLLRAEVPRLQNTFSSYVINEHPIAIKAAVSMNVPTLSQAKHLAKEEGLITIPIKLLHDTGSLFAIQMADMWIALIPEGLDDMLYLHFTEEEYTDFRRTLSDAGYSRKSKMQLSLRVLPTGADTQQPLVIQDFQLWMLMTKIISFELRSEDGTKVIWYKRIEGYDRLNGNQGINDLYKE